MGRYPMLVEENQALRRQIGWLLRWLVLPGAALLVSFRVVFRFLRTGSVTNRMRAFNRRITNPLMVTLAGCRYWYASVVRHLGRRSGKTYSTPVVAEPVEDGFIIPLPYGEGVDWLKNVLAAGTAAIKTKGVTYIMVEPQVIDVETAFPLLPSRVRRTWHLFGHLFGIERFLKVKRLSEEAITEDQPPAEIEKVETPSL
jgi:deazaflavin-dependent oxidoreductase (nitroreductase family)